MAVAVLPRINGGEGSIPRREIMRRLAPWCRGTFVLACLFATSANLVGQDKKDDPKKAESATLIIKCESAKMTDVELKIDGEKSTQTGATRKFITPELKHGPKYYYTVSAFWEPNNYTKITRTWKVYVKPGQTVTVDMTKPDPKQPIDDIKVRWVPTPEKVVDAMLKMAKVGKGDVVYDLGCGDGRIPITAVTKFGAKRGVGIDFDPEKIKESKAEAKAAKVEDKTEFREQDVFKVKDLGKATVVTTYMGEDLNRQLEPTLRKLKPGTRIVSHRFLIGNWKPDRTEKLEVAGEEYLIHLWTIKAKESPKKEVKKEVKKKEDKKTETKKEDKKKTDDDK
jgi:uncharacterized protein (TIGR03000 family)